MCVNIMINDSLYLKYLAKTHESKFFLSKDDIDIQKFIDFIEDLTKQKITVLHGKYLLNLIKDELIIIDIIDNIINKI